MTSKAAVYVRISRPDERAILENQKAAALDYVGKKGWQLHGVYEDVASGGDEDRPGLNALLSDTAKFDLVVFTSLSRMTRGGIESALYTLGRLDRAGVGWHFIEEPILNFDASTNPLAKDIVLAVIAAINKDYRRGIQEKTKAAYERKKAAAEAVGQKVRWGYPPGRPKPRCAVCGRTGTASVHRSGFHAYVAEDGKCAVCGKASRESKGHVAGWHRYQKQNATPNPPQSETGTGNRDDSEGGGG